MNLEKAQTVGRQVVWRMRPYCERVEIAGSVRRKKEEVKDIEIVFWPRMIRPQGSGGGDSLFDVEAVEGPDRVPSTDVMVSALVSSGFWSLDQAVKRNGPRYKRLKCCGEIVEIYRADAWNWGWIFLLRTGPADFCHAIVAPQWNEGFLPVDTRVREGYVYVRGQRVAVPDETTFLGLWGIPFIAPTHRSVGALRMVTGWRRSSWTSRGK